MDRIVEEEVALCRKVREALDKGPRAGRASEADVVVELERLREQLIAGIGEEDRAALMSEYNRLSALLGQLRESRAAPRVGRDSPYFGHLEMDEQGRRWDVCLGKASFIEHGVNIVDWRNAPISTIFYRYRQGEDFEEEIAGRTRIGVVRARRTVTIRDGRLRRIESPEGVFSRADAAPPARALPDGARSDPARSDVARRWRRCEVDKPRLAAAAGATLRERGSTAGPRRLGATVGGASRVDKHLPDIAGLIDPEQFAIITRPSSGLVVIRGTAGSGKTTVALHRIAFLAYEEPAFDSPQSLVLVFSRALRDYVSHVLPALGVARVRVETFAEWAAELRRSHFPMLPSHVRDDAPSVVQRLKQHPLMLEALAQQARRETGERDARQAVDDWGSVLTNRALLEEIFVAAGVFRAAEIERVCEWGRARHAEVLAWLDGDRDAEAALDSEDDALLLRAFQLRVGPLRGRRGREIRYRHVAIDEVQDFSPLEVRVLLDCLDRRRSMTLAGDTQQHVLQDAGFTSWNAFFRHLGLEGSEVETLRVSYRSTREIVAFAQSVLGPLREDEEMPMTTRSGLQVEWFRFTDHGACVAFLAEVLVALAIAEPSASVALLTPSEAISELYERVLLRAEVPGVHRVRDQRYSFAPGIEITEIDQVKGLEFDYVVIVEASSTHYPDSGAARRLLHVGATRAIHQLWLTSVATPSPMLVEALRGE